MQRIPGWIVGALVTAAVLGAFYVGGRTSAAPAAPAAESLNSTGVLPGVEFACEPDQRVVIRDATASSAQSFTCVGATPAALSQYAAAPASVFAVADRTAPRPYAQPAVITEPLEVYRPRSVPVSYQSQRDVRTPVRTKTKSAVIIGGSTAVGATIGGLAKGTKGAIVGGLLGGGAAAVWDQVTRRQRNDR